MQPDSKDAVRQALLALDAEVLRLYDLPPRLERQLLDLFTGVVRNMRIFPKRMMANLELTRGLPFSPRVLLALVESGMDRTEAYKKVQALAMRSWDEELDFRELLRADRAVKDAIGAEKLETLFDYEHFLRYTRHTYRRLGFSVPADPVTAN